MQASNIPVLQGVPLHTGLCRLSGNACARPGAMPS